MRLLDKFFRTIAEEELYIKAKEMGFTDHEIRRFQMKRLMMCLGILAFSVFAYQAFGWIYGVVTLFGIPFFWIYKYRGFKNVYQRYTVNQQMYFSDFISTLVPYLLNTGVKRSLFANLELVAEQMKNNQFKKEIHRFLGEINDMPNDIEPFIHFAKRCGGTDEVINFMMTLFRYQQYVDDFQVIQELSRIANKEVFKGVDYIVESKITRMSKLVMKAVMYFGVALLSVMGAEIFYVVKNVLDVMK